MADRSPATVHERMAWVTDRIAAIAKQGSDNVSYRFRTIDALLNALHRPLADAGLTLHVRVLDDWQINMIPGTNNRVQTQALFRVCVDVWAPDGCMVTIGPGLAQSHDYGDKAVYQAQQNAVKYLLLTAFSIPIDEPDMDSRPADEVPSEQLAEVDRLIDDAKALGIPGKYDQTREWASVSGQNAAAAISRLRTEVNAALAKLDAQDGGEGG